MKNIVVQQRKELEYLQSIPYQPRHLLKVVEPYLDSTVIKLITGPRRAGKSVFALQMLSKKNFAYLNFDDSLLLEHFDENEIMQTLSEVYPGYTYLLLDEIQNLGGWDMWVGKLRRRGINLVLTGSNAKMLSSEMATVLTGRYIEIEMLPFSLSECLSYQNIHKHPELPEEKGILMNEIDAYLRIGGLKKKKKTREIAKSYIGSLFDSTILKDVAGRHKLRKTQELYQLADYLISNYCNQLSYNEIAKNMNMGSVTTVKKFCNYLAEPYLFFYLPRFNNKLRLMKNAPKKVYVVDNGFIFARSFELSANKGRQLENMVYIELLRRGYKTGDTVFYYHTKNDREIDFVLRESNRITQLIQVAYELSTPKSRERELRALEEAARELNCENLLLITWANEEIAAYKEVRIRITSVREWFLSGS